MTTINEWVNDFRFRAENAETWPELMEFKHDFLQKAIKAVTAQLKDSVDDVCKDFLEDDFYHVYAGGILCDAFNRFSYDEAKECADKLASELDGEDIWIDARGETLYEIEALREPDMEYPDDGT